MRRRCWLTRGMMLLLLLLLWWPGLSGRLRLVGLLWLLRRIHRVRWRVGGRVEELLMSMKLRMKRAKILLR